MGLVLTVAILLIGLFICIVNSIYRKIETKNHSEWKKSSVFNSPNAWTLYAICIAIIIGGIFITSFRNVMTGFSNVGKQQNTITQQQDTSNQQQDDPSAQQQNSSTQK